MLLYAEPYVHTTAVTWSKFLLWHSPLKMHCKFPLLCLLPSSVGPHNSGEEKKKKTISLKSCFALTSLLLLWVLALGMLNSAQESRQGYICLQFCLAHAKVLPKFPTPSWSSIGVERSWDLKGLETASPSTLSDYCWASCCWSEQNIAGLPAYHCCCQHW